jgi:hypothetical protein
MKIAVVGPGGIGSTFASRRRVVERSDEPGSRHGRGISLGAPAREHPHAAPVAAVSRLPTPVVASLLWTGSRLGAIRKAGAAGYGEPRTLIDAMSAAAPGETPALLAVRP